MAAAVTLPPKVPPPVNPMSPLVSRSIDPVCVTGHAITEVPVPTDFSNVPALMNVGVAPAPTFNPG